MNFAQSECFFRLPSWPPRRLTTSVHPNGIAVSAPCAEYSCPVCTGYATCHTNLVCHRIMTTYMPVPMDASRRAHLTICCAVAFSCLKTIHLPGCSVIPSSGLADILALGKREILSSRISCVYSGIHKKSLGAEMPHLHHFDSTFPGHRKRSAPKVRGSTR